MSARRAEPARRRTAGALDESDLDRRRDFRTRCRTRARGDLRGALFRETGCPSNDEQRSSTAGAGPFAVRRNHSEAAGSECIARAGRDEGASRAECHVGTELGCVPARVCEDFGLRREVQIRRTVRRRREDHRRLREQQEIVPRDGELRRLM